ncbi:MAG: protein translocase subunit SecD, partial [Gammaproteobacteria bacterium]
MNRYPLWKNLLILSIIVLGAIYALPNLYGEYPALQISTVRSAPLDAALEGKVRAALKEAQLEPLALERDARGLLVRLTDTEAQLKANDAVAAALGSDYVVALNLAPATPAWLQALGAKPMYLGLDLRGGVHFLMEVDMEAVVRMTEERFVSDLRSALREKKIRYKTIARDAGRGILVTLRDAASQSEADELLDDEFRDLNLVREDDPEGSALQLTLKEDYIRETRKLALQQNLTTLRNRVNELGVAEPIIQQHGLDRIVVQLPGVQDTARAKEILGATATLEFRMQDEEHDPQEAVEGRTPPGAKLYRTREG